MNIKVIKNPIIISIIYLLWNSISFLIFFFWIYMKWSSKILLNIYWLLVIWYVIITICFWSSWNFIFSIFLHFFFLYGSFEEYFFHFFILTIDPFPFIFFDLIFLISTFNLFFLKIIILINLMFSHFIKLILH